MASISLAYSSDNMVPRHYLRHDDLPIVEFLRYLQSKGNKDKLSEKECNRETKNKIDEECHLKVLQVDIEFFRSLFTWDTVMYYFICTLFR